VVTGARSRCASSQLTEVDQKSRTVLSRALRQCSVSTEPIESRSHICRIAALPSRH